MPIRRPKGPKPTLRHLAFLEAMAISDEGSPSYRKLFAGLLTLRLVDEWATEGSLVMQPDATALQATRVAIDGVDADAETRVTLTRIVDAMAMMQDADVQPVLPRLFAYASILENRSSFALAADVFRAVAKHVDAQAHFDLAYDAWMKQGFCFRMVANFEMAERGYSQAGLLAGRTRDRGRVLLARIGEAKVTWGRGNLPEAQEQLEAIAAEADSLGDHRLHAVALHELAAVARLRNEIPTAVRLAHDALRRMTREDDRERVLTDLGNFLGYAGAFDTARAALGLIAERARTQELRWNAQVNLMDLAVREGSETRFEQLRRSIEQLPLSGRMAADFFRDAARGLARFGRMTEARAALARSRDIAERAGLHQVTFELDALERRLDQETSLQPITPTAAPADVAETVEAMVRAGALA
ncbi:MAG: hypothetical protein KF689_12660 [Gemmatimonadaceae bacterium]|nr:hypothetical protein [Gemmatimonadaceae bacterium]MCW5827166.1 hypothetical protein [Gemmatimonadaceae bacterium]